MHVMVIPSWYSSEENPVHGNFFKEQFIALHEKGQKITVCYNEVWPLNKIKGKWVKGGISVGVENDLNTYRYRGYNFLPRNTKMFSLFNKRMEKLYLKIVSEQGKVDIIHCHSCFWGGISAAYISKKYNIPLVITEHSSLKYAKYCKESYKPYIYEAYNNANKLIAVSNSLKNEMKEYTDNNIVVINNMVDDKRFNISKELWEDFTFLSCGYLVEGKGFEMLIDAFYKAFRGSNVKLRIVGEGYLRQRLEGKIKSLDLQHNIELLGLLNREELKKEFDKCNTFVLASEHETFGMVYVEAMCSGKPVIGTLNGGAEDIIDENVGVLIEPNNSEALKNAMILMQKNFDKYKPEEIRKQCILRFGRNTIINEIIGVYNQVKGAK
ncbi:MAG: glycosyltransferase [Clostridium sp.]